MEWSDGIKDAKSIELPGKQHNIQSAKNTC